MVTASYDTLHSQAMKSADDYFNNAVKTIDESFGEWYAKGNPTLIYKYMEIASREYTEAVQMKSMEEMDEKYWKDLNEK